MRFNKLAIVTILLFGMTFAKEGGKGKQVKKQDDKSEKVKNEEIQEVQEVQEAQEAQEAQETQENQENQEGNQEEECWAKKLNYPCCKKDNCMKVYVNDDGAWGFENWKWCGIYDTEYCEKKAKECWAEKLGYKCCPENVCTPYHTDDNGAWGILDDEWCGIVSSVCKRDVTEVQQKVKLPFTKPTRFKLLAQSN